MDDGSIKQDDKEGIEVASKSGHSTSTIAMFPR
jgi:hypothetical protein